MGTRPVVGAQPCPNATNLLGALRSFEKDTELKGALGQEFADAYVKLKTNEWNSYASHFTQWERENTLDV